MEERELLKIAKALADETRFRIFKAIVASGEISCGDLASQFPVAQPTVSHHVKVLVDAGLVVARRQGQHSYFCATANALEEFRRCLAMELIAVDSQETTVAAARRRQRRAVRWSTPEKPVAVP